MGLRASQNRKAIGEVGGRHLCRAGVDRQLLSATNILQPTQLHSGGGCAAATRYAYTFTAPLPTPSRWPLYQATCLFTCYPLPAPALAPPTTCFLRTRPQLVPGLELPGTDSGALSTSARRRPFHVKHHPAPAQTTTTRWADVRLLPLMKQLLSPFPCTRHIGLTQCLPSWRTAGAQPRGSVARVGPGSRLPLARHASSPAAHRWHGSGR